MVGSRTGLVVLVALALVLGGALAVDLLHAPAGVPSRALVPGFVEGDVRALSWTRGGRATARVEREGDFWVISGSPVRADAEPVGAVLAALRGGAWHRRGEVALAGPIGQELVVTEPAETRTLGLGAALAGGEQTWLVVAEHAVLVDTWVARALFPEPGRLRVSALFADVRGRVTVTRGEATLALDLDRGALVEPAPLVLAPAHVAAMREALTALVVTRWLPAPLPGGDGLVIATADRRLELRGACPVAPELEAVHTNFGDGCSDAAAVAAVAALVARLSGSPEAVADARPRAARPAHLVLLDGATLDLTKQPRLLPPGGGAPVDVDATRVAALMAALGEPGMVIARPEAAPRGTLVADGVALAVWADGTIARPGEPVAVRVSPAARAALLAPSAELRDSALWSDEPTAIAELTIDGEHFTRGAVLGEWTGATPARRLDLDALAEAVAAPRSTGADAPPSAPAGKLHHVDARVLPPIGAEVHRVFELEAIGERCALRAPTGSAWIAPAACSARAKDR